MSSITSTPITTIPAVPILPLSISGEVVPVSQPASPPAMPSTDPADAVISLTLRDLALVSAAVLLGKNGLVWFDFRPDGIEISAAGDSMAFTHRSKATIRGSSANCRGFGVPAGEIASIAQWALRRAPAVGLDLHFGTDEIIAIPNPTLITHGIPLEACLIGIPESPVELKSFLFDNLPQFPLTGYFERPADIAKQEDRNDLGQIHRAALVAALSAVKHLVPTDDTRRDLELLELHDGLLYGGGQDAMFLCTTPFLAGADVSFTREQLRPLLRLLRLLPSQTCQLARDADFHIISDSCTTLYARVPDLRHPADGLRLLGQQPEAGIIVDADKLLDILEALQKGRGKHCPDAWFHASLAVGHSVLKIESRRPSDGAQTVKGCDLHCQVDQPGLAYDFLTPQAGLVKAVAGCEGKVHLRTRPLPPGETRTEQWQHVYVSASITDAPTSVRTVRLPGVLAQTPDRLAKQVRRLPKVQVAIKSPGRKPTALS